MKLLSLVCLAVDIVASISVGASPAPVQNPFAPTWDSLKANYEYPDWFRDAKFGIWAHWGPQCQPEQGDGYAHEMYNPGHRDYKYHLEHYEHPSEIGFKDVINTWKAENRKPDDLIELYRQAGTCARYRAPRRTGRSRASSSSAYPRRSNGCRRQTRSRSSFPPSNHAIPPMR